METPFPDGIPRRSTRSAPRGASRRRRSRRTVIWPSASGCCETVPLSGERNERGGLGVTSAVLRIVGRGSKDAGVPARRAHPRWSGPPRYQPRRRRGTTTAASTPVSRTLRGAAPRPRRATTATTTTTSDPTPTTASQVARGSLPVPSACMSATGHEAYASRCTARHARMPMRTRSRLVTTIASRRSNATAPSPSQTGRYADAKGTSASVSRIGA